MTSTITGRVRDAAGQAIVGASVAITDSDQPHRDIAAITRADGSFKLSGLKPGNYTLQAHHEGKFAAVSAQLGSEGAADVEIKLG